MKLSIVTAVFNSHEVVRRQILHYQKNPLVGDVEVVLVDDGSNPPIIVPEAPWLKIVRTGDSRLWTEHIARNRGAEAASGDYLFMADIDYIIPQWTILKVLNFNGDRMAISRSFGVLDEDGRINTESKTLRYYGLKKRWIRKRHFPGHRSQYVIRKDLFFKLGGYPEDGAGENHPNGGGPGARFWAKWRRLQRRDKVKISEETAQVFMFPCGKYAIAEDPLELFHKLPRVEKIK